MGIAKTLSRSGPVITNECWKEKPFIDSDVKVRNNKWEKVQEDNLKITSCCGPILFLRFFCDLEASQLRFDSHCTEEKSNALIWCQTIIRICDPDVLVQYLPHLGDDLEEEDLVHFAQRSHDTGMKRVASYRRLSKSQFFLHGKTHV